jgi:hypothetical protein
MFMKDRSWKRAERFWQEAGEQGEEFPLLKQGFFGGESTRLLESLQEYHRIAKLHRRNRFEDFPDCAKIYENSQET